MSDLGTRRIRGLVIAHTTSHLLGWLTLHYGWGLSVNRWSVVLGFWVWACLIWPVLIPYILRDRSKDEQA